MCIRDRYGELIDIGRGLMEHEAPRPAVARSVRRLLRSLSGEGLLRWHAREGAENRYELLVSNIEIASRRARAAAEAADARVAPRRDLAETESRLRELAQFHQAVMGSRSWKLLQRLRGLFGRAW